MAMMAAAALRDEMEQIYTTDQKQAETEILGALDFDIADPEAL